MTTHSSNLPEFKTPPVIEVVCGIQFAALARFSSVHYGEFWQYVKNDYPSTEDKTPVAELFEDRPNILAPTELLMDVPPLRRVFYIDPTQNYLLQLQPSRFLANWRRVRESDDYPRFPAAHGRFLAGWQTFLRFVRDKGWDNPEANQYELTYINHMFPIEKGFPAGIEYFLPLLAWSKSRSVEFLPEPSALALRAKFPLSQDRGALHVKVDHGNRPDAKQVLVVDLTARGPAAKDWSDMDTWFSLAHESIVRGFTDLTSSRAHTSWGRTQ
jgi:uncharacterized protein (TIGR04255 family)